MLFIDRFIQWVCTRDRSPQNVVTFDDKFLFQRYAILRYDEWHDELWDRYRERYPRRPHSLPWWQPFNAFVHRWNPEPGLREGFHDHPRWSITICLKGQITERTPWGSKTLRPGSFVIRSHKAIHAFENCVGETWTLFIVGRRRHRQNTYLVTAR